MDLKLSLDTSAFQASLEELRQLLDREDLGALPESAKRAILDLACGSGDELVRVDYVNGAIGPSPLLSAILDDCRKAGFVI